MGTLHEKSIVKVTVKQGLAILVINCIIPGAGTVIAGFIVGGDVVVNNLVIGSLQLYFTCLLIGWIWSIYTGWLIY